MDDAMVEAAAYCVGGESDRWVFRLLRASDKQRRLREIIGGLRSNAVAGEAFPLRLEAIARLPDAPLAYWLNESVIKKLIKPPSFEPVTGVVRKGLRTGDNFRFVRAHWEVSPERVEVDGTAHDTASGWVPLVMKGASQPWFSPIYLLLNWHSGGRELRAFVLKYGTESRLIQAKEYYFAPGFSWTLRAARLYPYAIPPGCIFTGSRPMAFPVNGQETPYIVSLFSSRLVSAFLRLYGEQFARPKFLEGKLKLVPVPSLDDKAKIVLVEAFRHGIAASRRAYQYYEPFLEFVAPRSLAAAGEDAALSFDRGAILDPRAEAVLRDALELTPGEADILEMDLREALELAQNRSGEDADDSDEEREDAVVLSDGLSERGWRVVSYAFGCAVGRWDIRNRAEKAPLVEDEVSRVRAVPAGTLDLAAPTDAYPIRILASGIGHDDSGSPADLPGLVEECIRVIGEDLDAVLKAIDAPPEGVRGVLRRGFFQFHLATYTLGRRKAPIFWQLATPSAGYSVWLYLHAFSKDTLFRVHNDYIAPKLAHEERRLESLSGELRDGATAAQRKQLSTQEAQVEELRAFVDEVKRVAPLWKPDLDDGVIINFAPLWRLVPQNRSWQKELKSTWVALCEGEYDWSHLAMHLWPERVVPKCVTDRSLAIAHGLEDALWVEGADGKWKSRTTPPKFVEELVRERTSPAVKAALKSLLDAPSASGPARAGRRPSRNSASTAGSN
jgi:hypothetical protein